MQKIFIILLTGLLFQGSMAQETVRNITDINNNSIVIDSLQGTKLLLIVLPAQTDTAFNNQLLRFQKTYSQMVKVLGLVSVQTGTASKEFYEATYGDASRLGVIVTEGISAGEKVENERASMIQWMSTRSDNRQQDRYVVGTKYFLSEEGRLYAQLGKGTSLDDPLVKCIVNTQVPTARMMEAPKTAPASQTQTP